jgi:hypothetical protein
MGMVMDLDFLHFLDSKKNKIWKEIDDI